MTNADRDAEDDRDRQARATSRAACRSSARQNSALDRPRRPARSAMALKRRQVRRRDQPGPRHDLQHQQERARTRPDGRARCRRTGRTPSSRQHLRDVDFSLISPSSTIRSASVCTDSRFIFGGQAGSDDLLGHARGRSSCTSRARRGPRPGGRVGVLQRLLHRRREPLGQVGLLGDAPCSVVKYVGDGQVGCGVGEVRRDHRGALALRDGEERLDDQAASTRLFATAAGMSGNGSSTNCTSLGSPPALRIDARTVVSPMFFRLLIATCLAGQVLGRR